MMRWSCQRLHGCVPVPPRAICSSRATLWILAAPLLHRDCRLAEVLAAAGSHLDLRRDQLADDVRGEIGLERRCIDLLEAIRQRQRLRVEQRELLFDGEGEVGAGLEVVAALRDQLLPGDALLVAHSAQRVSVRGG